MNEEEVYSTLIPALEKQSSVYKEIVVISEDIATSISKQLPTQHIIPLLKKKNALLNTIVKLNSDITIHKKAWQNNKKEWKESENKTKINNLLAELSNNVAKVVALEKEFSAITKPAPKVNINATNALNKYSAQKFN